MELQSAESWMGANLTTQGYCLSDDERRELAVGLRHVLRGPPLPANPARRRDAFAWWARRTDDKQPITT
jgi:hypothetical protein